VTTALHGIAYLLPGATWLGLAYAIRRVTARWLTPAASVPLWIRRSIVVSTVLLAATGLALTGVGAFLAIVIQL
jgi:hypothetical protein